MGRFISADAISELDAEELNGLNLYMYCANNPVMMNDTEGNAPAWWEWLISGALLVVGAVLCATGVGSVFGAGLIAAGGSMMASNTMSAIGLDVKVASIISAGLNIFARVGVTRRKYDRFYKIRFVSFFFEGGERGKLLFFVKRKKSPP